MDAMEPRQMAQSLSVPLFETPFFMPHYPDGQWGDWRIKHMGLGFDHGYYTRQWIVSDTPILMRRRPEDAESWETWMALTPHEIESQEPGAAFAWGHMVIMGLGMGWIAVNAALNPAVERVTVIERDSDVIEFFSDTGILKQIPAEIREKIEIVEADALLWQPNRPVDFLFADIWLNLDEAETLAQVQTMQRNINAKAVYFWGQELTLYADFRKLFGADVPLTFEGLEVCVRDEIRLPLILPWGAEYPNRIEAAVRNRRERGLMPTEQKR